MSQDPSKFSIRVQLVIVTLFSAVLFPAHSVQADMLSAKDRPLVERIYGTPIGTNVYRLDTADTIQISFKLNNLGNRVGILFEACKDPLGGTDRHCQNTLFYFPDLSYDKKNQEILRNKERIAKFGGSFESTSMYKPNAMGFEVEEITVDDGFDIHKGKAVKLYLGKETQKGGK